MLFDIINDLTQFLHREATLLMREVKLAHDTRRYRMTMQEVGLIFRKDKLSKAVADRMTRNSMPYESPCSLGSSYCDPLFHGDRLAYQTISNDE